MTTLRQGEIAHASIRTSNYNRCCDVTSASLLLRSHFLLCVSLRPAVRQRPKQATQQAGGGSWRFYSAVPWDATVHLHTFSPQRDPPVGEWRGSQQKKKRLITHSCAKKPTAGVAKEPWSDKVILYSTFTSFFPLPNSVFYEENQKTSCCHPSSLHTSRF